MDTFSIDKLAILGPGLLGGSLCLAAREKGLARTVALWGRRESVLREAEQGNFADHITGDVATAVEGADLVVLCTPVGVMPDLLSRAGPHLKSDAVVTDVGSVKAQIVREATAALGGRGLFVGSHPMAGSEQSGLFSARANLFDGAVCIVTPTAETAGQAANLVRAFWRAVGCHTADLDPQLHDETVALVSHVPHLLAALLVNFVCSQAGCPTQFAGTGLRDTTRVASGPVDMWREILTLNRLPIASALRTLSGEIQRAAAILEAGDENALQQLLEKAKQQRDHQIAKIPGAHPAVSKEGNE